MPTKVGHFIGLPPNERRTVARAVLAFPLVAVSLKLWKLATVLAGLARLTRRPREVASDEASDTARAVERVARGTPWRANCLQRSVVLWWLLGRRGIASDIRIGVAKPEGSARPLFHAWVELDGRVLNDRPDIGRDYAAFDRAIAPAGVRFN